MKSEDNPHLSNHEVEVKSGEAEAILHHHVFVGAMSDVYSRAVRMLLEADVGSLTAQQAHAMMKAINELKAQLEQYINDHKVRQKYYKDEGHNG